MTSITTARLDGLSSSAAIKGPCRTATTANITLSGTQTIDGVAVVANDRVLVKNQTSASENGIYVADTGPWRRASDFEKTRDVVKGTQVYVSDGVSGGTVYSVSATNPISVGTDNIAFTASSVGYAIPSVVRDYLDTAPYVATRTAMKALDTTKDTVCYLTESGREGVFLWRSGNFTTQHGLDTLEGIYVKATAIASAAGSWVRQNNRQYQVEWFGAVGDGTTNDGPAINGALAVGGVGVIIEFQDKVYATSDLISVSKDGATLRGRMGGATFSVSPTTTEGTVLKWTGASAGTLLYFGCLVGGSADMSGGGIEGIQFNGNLLADKVLHIRSCAFSTFRSLRICNARDNAAAVCLWLDSDVQARAGVNSIYRCNFYNTAIATGGAAAYGLWVTGASDETSGRHPAFTSFHGLHVTHDDGDAIHITSADDLLFADVGVSKVAGGTGHSVNLVPGAGRSVVGLTFIQLHLGSNDTPDFVADMTAASSYCHGIAIYGLQGVDLAPTITQVAGATIEIIDYLGTSYDPSAAVRGAYRKTPPLQLGNFANAGDDVLDYYKERLSNITITFGGAAVGVTYASNFYRTTRIGNTVFFKAQVSLTNKGSSAGNAVIGSLPYTAVDGYSAPIYATGMTAGVGDTDIVALLTTSGNIGLYKIAAGVHTAMTNADFSNTSSLIISGCYHTTDAAA